MPPRHLPIRLLAAFGIFLIVLEGSARVDDAWTEGAPLFSAYDLSILTTVDEFGIAGRPNSRFSKWRMNALGFRGENLKEDRAKVLCVGASETFGLYEPEGMEFPMQLERELNRRTSSVQYQVVNAGLPGQSLSSFGRRASVVIQRVRPRVAVLYPSLAIYIAPPPESWVRPATVGAPLFRPRIARRLASLLSDHVPVSLRTAARRIAIRLQTRHRVILTRIPESNVLRFRRDLSRLLDLLDGERVQTVLVTHATRFGASVTAGDSAMLIAWRELYPVLDEGGFLDMERRLNEVIRSEAVHRNLKLVDAAGFLHGADNFVEFVHFTARGAGVLAAAISDALPAQGTVEMQGGAGR